MTISKKKKCKKAKWLSEEALQIAVKRREVKNKGEKERYTHMSAEFQWIARRDKKAYFSDQCKEIEEKNRMVKTRDLKKIWDTKGTFHAKMGSIKDRNGMDLIEAKLLRRGVKNTQKNCIKKIFMTQIIMMIWITHLEPDILECEVNWALGSITLNKASGGNEIPVELFQILKDDAVKVLYSIRQQLWKTEQWPQDWKRLVFMAMPKNAQNTARLHSSHTLVKYCSKFSKPSLNSM